MLLAQSTWVRFLAFLKYCLGDLMMALFGQWTVFPKKYPYMITLTITLFLNMSYAINLP